MYTCIQYFQLDVNESGHKNIDDQYCSKIFENQYLFLVNDQRDAQCFSMYLFLFLTVYMFRAHRAHHQER
jgi:hypothetical protein